MNETPNQNRNDPARPGASGNSGNFKVNIDERDLSTGTFDPAQYPERPARADLSNGTASRTAYYASDKERKALSYEISGPVEEREVTQASRQKHFENKETTDDHGMVIIGTAVDQEGNRYYKVKNSWDTNQLYKGYIYVSEPYFLEKTIGVTLNKAMVPVKK